MLELGPSEQNIAKQAARSGQPLPERIANAPSLKLGLEFYLQAFFDLDSERVQGLGPGRIPWSAMTRYAEHHGLMEDETEMLRYFLQYIDTAYLNHKAEKNG